MAEKPGRVVGVHEGAVLPYRGVDRRSRNAAGCGPPAPSRVLAHTAVLWVGAGIPALFFIPRQPSPQVLHTYLVAATAFLALVAGVAALVSWRLLGRALHAWSGTGLVGLGVLTLAGLALAWSEGGSAHTTLQPLGEVVVSLVVGGLLWRAVTDSEVNAGFDLLPVLVAPIGGGLLALGGLHVLRTTGALGALGTLQEVAATVTACIWLAVTVATVRAARRRRHGTGWVGVVAVLLGTGACLEALPSPAAVTVAAAALAFTATSLALGTEAARLDLALRNDAWQLRNLSHVLSATQRQTRRHDEELDEWLHDLRNAVAGLRSVDAVLRHGYDRDVADRVALADAVSSELARLEDLVDPRQVVHPVETELADVVIPAVAAEEAAGIPLGVGEVRALVRVDAHALGRALQNVLVNAKRYAPASPVTVWATACGDHVELRVRDRGPGVPATERQAIFTRGMRGSTSHGTDGDGLGLYVARRLLRAMGGDIQVDPEVRPGCCMLLSLPAVGTTAGRCSTGPALAGPGPRWAVSEPFTPAYRTAQG